LLQQEKPEDPAKKFEEGKKMSNINKFVLEYSTMFRENSLDYDNRKPPKKAMQRFVRYLKEIDDPRKSNMIDYPLEEIFVISFLAILAGAERWDDIELFGQAYKKWLKKFLKLKNGIPSHDTFRRVFGLIDSKQLEKVTVAFMLDVIRKLKKNLKISNNGKQHIIVDGKEANATGRKKDTDEEIKNLQTLHIYDNSDGICLYSELIDSKTNEIPVAQSILKQMDLKNSIVTFDALHTQKNTISIIRENKGDYVGALKGNQTALNEEVRDYFSEEILGKIKEKGTDYYSTKEKAHNQVETREFYLSKNVKWFEELDLWMDLKSFICYKKTIVNLVTNKQTTETRYYISNLTDVVECGQAIRGHWGIENSLHWYLDAVFHEDDNTTVDKNAFNNFSIMNKMTLALLKLSKPVFKKNSIASMRKQFGWVMQDCMSKVLNFFSDEDIADCLKTAIKTKN
jgi:predicted transposase YbfD/YdcC